MSSNALSGRLFNSLTLCSQIKCDMQTGFPLHNVTKMFVVCEVSENNNFLASMCAFEWVFTGNPQRCSSLHLRVCKRVYLSEHDGIYKKKRQM